MSYGRHQSFYLRKNWITKGLNILSHDKTAIYKNKFQKIGLGKNMVDSLRFWIEFSDIVTLVNGEHHFTEFGNLILEHDKGCTKNITLNLIHYFLSVDNTDLNYPIYFTFNWFFNLCNEVYFDKENLISELLEWDRRRPGRDVAKNTIKRDIDCLINTYTKGEPEHPEDKNFSLLGNLGLIKQEGTLFYKAPIKEDKISIEAFYFIILMQKQKLSDLTLDDLVNNENSIGKIFNLNRVAIMDILAKIGKEYPIRLEKTANLNNINIVSDAKRYNEPFRFLRFAYGKSV